MLAVAIGPKSIDAVAVRKVGTKAGSIEIVGLAPVSSVTIPGPLVSTLEFRTARLSVPPAASQLPLLLPSHKVVQNLLGKQ